MGWSVRIALMACFTQNSGFRGGRKGSISFLSGMKMPKIQGTSKITDWL